jgi:hypothetical protein
VPPEAHRLVPHDRLLDQGRVLAHDAKRTKCEWLEVRAGQEKRRGEALDPFAVAERGEAIEKRCPWSDLANSHKSMASVLELAYKALDRSEVVMRQCKASPRFEASSVLVHAE